MKKIISVILAVIMLTGIFAFTVSADESDLTFSYELTIDGKTVKYAEPGDVITVVLHLQRTDADESYTMYAMQSQIQYDEKFFELVPDSALVSKDIRTELVDMRGNVYKQFYMNYLSFSGGASWKAKTLIGSFQLKVIATEGATVITNENVKVSHRDGMASYDCAVNSLQIIVTDQCKVILETGEGSKVDPITVGLGEKLPHIPHPEKEGKYFAGWYKDIDCTIPWDFENDVVDGNVTLYAKWSDTPVDSLPCDKVEPGITTEPVGGDGEKDGGLWWLWLLLILLLIIILIIILLAMRKTVTFDSNGGSAVPSQKVFKNGQAKRPSNPTRAGFTFVGWAKDSALTVPFKFATDKITEDVTLYAKWKPMQ